MNGGSVSARATCIKKICENITNGDIRKGEVIFNEIVKDGVAGLMKQEEIVEEDVETNEPDDADGEDVQKVEEMDEDPSVKAMKAAASLDRETADIQQESIEDVASGNHQASSTEQRKAAVQDAKDDVFTSEIGNDIVRTIVTIPTKIERTLEKRNTFGPRCPTSATTPVTATPSYTAPVSQQTEDGYDYDCDDDYDPDLVSPSNDSFCISPKPAVYGEACVVDVQSTRRVKSTDRFFPSNSGYVDRNSGSPGLLKHAKSAYHLGRPGTSNGRMQKDEYHAGFQTLSRTTFMRASTTTIKKSPSSGESRSSSISTSKIRGYVDRGADAEEVVMNEAEEITPFEPVFPVIEDLVIHFAHDTPNDIFEYVLSAYKNGSYPIHPPTPEPQSSSTPASPTSVKVPKIRPTSRLTAETDDDGFHRRHEFDPYADNNYPGGINQWPLKHDSTRSETSRRDLEPPTPSLTPPPTARGIAERFCEYSPVNPNSVIGIQNSLRSLLNLHFPAGENGYTQYYYPVCPETDRLWKPVFRNDENASIGSEGRTVDQIIALGCEEGVKKDFFAQVSGQIEKLGMKRDGINRSSRIDLRFVLICESRSLK
jgi:hypothetical protein